MNPNQTQGNDTPDHQKPVAYDAQGRPLYAHPHPVIERSHHGQADPNPGSPVVAETHSKVTQAPASYDGHNFDPRHRIQASNEPGIVHAARDYEPVVSPVSQELQTKHEESKRHYPHLNLSDGEFVILNIRRHFIGLLMPVLATIFLTVVVLTPLVFYPWFADTFGDVLPAFDVVALPVILLAALVMVGGVVSIWVYLQNQFYMTNESVIQEIQHSLFSRHEQTVSLGSIEDASFKQSNIIQTLFNYGTIRLSTEGEETTYRFHYVENPKEQVAILNNAVESFKNGRPVDHNDN